MENILEINNLTKKYGNKTVLSSFSAEFKKGEIYGLVGNNGAGKTTLLKLICGLIKPNDGEIKFASIKKEDKRDKKISIGALIESVGYFPEMTAYENLKAKGLCLGYDCSKDTINALLNKVGLNDVAKKRVGKFSTGMKQRLAIALALMGEPELLLLDEPLNGLDPQGINEVRKIIAKIPQELNTTIILSSHILDELFKVATRFIILKDGKLLKNISKNDLIKEKGDLPIDEYYLKLIK